MYYLRAISIYLSILVSVCVCVCLIDIFLNMLDRIVKALCISLLGPF